MFDLNELKAVMTLLSIGAKAERKKVGELAFVSHYGAEMASALVKLQAVADGLEKIQK